MTKNNNHVDVDYSQKILEVKNLKKYFYVGVGKNKLKVPAVDNVSFDIHKREVFGLVGESGCGKTTTGRTIIKLYTPTDGTVDLNGIRIGAGYDSIVENIKKIKREAKEKILRLNPTSFKKYQINQEAEKSINFIKQDIDELKQKQIASTKELMSPIEKYADDLYQLKNLYTLDIARFNYDFALKKGEIENLKHNKAEKEYKNELLIAENTYKHKLDGLKDSAALTKETIEERIKNLKSIYQETLSDLEKTYSPLIEQAEKDRLPNSEVKIRIQALKKERDDLISKRHNQFENDKQKFQKPDEAKIKEKVIESKKEFKLQIDKKQQEIKDIKAKAKMSILEISKQKDEKHLAKSNKDEIDAIKKERHEQIKLEKEQIRNVKDVNKSKEALAASRKMQMIFQDPISSLNPRMTVKEIVSEGLVILGGYSDEEISKRVSDVLELVGLSAEYATRYPHEFSGGQRQRIGIARALIMNPNFIIADEPISALDVSIRAQVINLLRELREELGLTILFIAHDLSVVRFFCDRIAVMYYGKLVELAPSEELFANPMHPYTKSLLSAIPQPDPDYEKGRQRINYDPSQHDYRLDKPSLREVAPGHMVFANDKEYEIIKKEYEISAHKKATDLED
ncbi:MAG: ATP-binding cassette domain-containing protein [Acholeplasmataceae bacterium]|nr:ATP-binding cassette domain-containing protein [Acholeplasmataceae bacterium]